MTQITIRRARLDDTDAISRLYRDQIGTWQRIDAHGRVESLPYDALTVYERWTHGGAWMSIETGAVLLSRLLQGAGVALVAETGGTVTGYAEAYMGSEPPPFGDHLHLGELNGDEASVDALMQHLLQDELRRDARRGLRLTVGVSGEGAAAFYGHYGLQPVSAVQRYTLPAKTGQIFYKVEDGSQTASITGWHQTIGRTESARHAWEHLWARVWDDVLPETQARHTHRLHIGASGHEALVCVRQQMYDLRRADVACWSPKPLSGQLLTAIRDWAHRQSYRTLALVVTPETAKVLGTEAEADPFTRQIYASSVG